MLASLLWPNDRADLPGPLRGPRPARSRNAAPVKSSPGFGAGRPYFFSRSTTAVIRPALLVKSAGRSLPLGSKQTFNVSPFIS